MKPETFRKLARDHRGRNLVFRTGIDPESPLKDIYSTLKPMSWVALGRGFLVTQKHRQFWWLHEIISLGKVAEKQKKEDFERYYKLALFLSGRFKGKAGWYCIQLNQRSRRYGKRLSHVAKFKVSEQDIRKMQKPIHKLRFYVEMSKPTTYIRRPSRSNVHVKNLHDVILEVFEGE
jgi:hypothetical protein